MWLPAGSHSSVANSCPKPMALPGHYRGPEGLSLTRQWVFANHQNIGQIHYDQLLEDFLQRQRGEIPLRTGSKNKEQLSKLQSVKAPDECARLTVTMKTSEIGRTKKI